MKIVALISIVLGSFICFCNWYTIYDSWRKKRFVSAVPAIGALFLGLGLAYFEKTRPYAIFSIVADYGTLIFLIAIPRLAKELWSTSKINLTKSLIGNNDIADYKLKLFKKEIFVLEVTFSPPQIANEHGAKIVSFGFQGNWQESEGSILLTDYNADRTLELTKSNCNYIAKEFNYPDDAEYRYDQLDGITFIS